MPRLILLLALGQALAAQDPREILRRHFAADAENAKLAAQYTYVQEDTHFSYDKGGIAKETGRETYDVVFVEGEEYKKLISRNGQPLNAKDQAKEDGKMQDIAKERRKQRRNGLFHRTVTIGRADNEYLLTHFENRLLGVEERDGRKVWVIESLPRADKKPLNDHERDVLSFRWTHWIDQAEHTAVKWQIVVVGEKAVLKPGTTMTLEYKKFNDEAWLPTAFLIDFHAQFMKFMKDNGRQESKYSNYRKFDVQSTITVEATQ